MIHLIQWGSNALPMMLISISLPIKLHHTVFTSLFSGNPIVHLMPCLSSIRCHIERSCLGIERIRFVISILMLGRG